MDKADIPLVDLLTRLSPAQLTAIIPFLNDSSLRVIAAVLCNVLFYRTGTKLSSTKRNYVLRVAEKHISDFRALSNRRLANQQRRALIQKRIHEVVAILKAAKTVLVRVMKQVLADFESPENQSENGPEA